MSYWCKGSSMAAYHVINPGFQGIISSWIVKNRKICLLFQFISCCFIQGNILRNFPGSERWQMEGCLISPINPFWHFIPLWLFLGTLPRSFWQHCLAHHSPPWCPASHKSPSSELGLEPDDFTKVLSRESEKKAVDHQFILCPSLHPILLYIFWGCALHVHFWFLNLCDRTCKSFGTKGVGIVLPGSHCAEAWL